MPEYPEIAITAKHLETLTGQLLTKVVSRKINSYSEINTYCSEKINCVYSDGKTIYIVAAISKFKIKLGLTGYILVSDSNQEPESARVTLSFKGSGTRKYLYIIDERAFGGLDLVEDLPSKRNVVLEKELFISKVTNRRAPIFSVLVNQDCAPGVGSYLAQESLYKSGISPTRNLLTATDAGNIHKNLLEIINLSINCGGATWGKFLYPDGTKGRYYEKLSIYGRRGGACYSCQNILSTVKINSRVVRYCETCQH